MVQPGSVDVAGSRGNSVIGCHLSSVLRDQLVSHRVHPMTLLPICRGFLSPGSSPHSRSPHQEPRMLRVTSTTNGSLTNRLCDRGGLESRRHRLHGPSVTGLAGRRPQGPDLLYSAPSYPPQPDRQVLFVYVQKQIHRQQAARHVLT